MALTNNYARVTTPKGTAEYPHIEEPDYKFDDDGLYHVNLILDKSEANGIIETVESCMNDFLANDPRVKEAKAKGRSFTVTECFEEVDSDTVRLKFKQKASYTRKSDGKKVEVKIPVFDAKGVPALDTKIGGGSIIRVCFSINPYYMPATRSAGASLRLVAVKLIKEKQWGANNAEAFGFGEEEEGYDSTKIAPVTKSPEPAQEETFDSLEEDTDF